VTVNHNGKRERVAVDLQVVYAAPDEPGAELSFEEVWAAKRGLLNKDWTPRRHESPIMQISARSENNDRQEVDVLAEAMSAKLVVHHDIVRLDENGAIVEAGREGRPKKKKVMEVNETQISKTHQLLSLASLCPTDLYYSQSKVGLTLRAQAQEERFF
jgi:checkpoint serine/threonine-protein kinase